MVIHKDKQKVEEWFKFLRNEICKTFEDIENKFKHSKIKNKPGKFKKKKWFRKNGGGGEMAIMKGRIFEKVGVNVSTVFGNFSKEFRNKIPGCKKSPKFWASGISLVAHLHSPYITAAHFNTRHIITSKSWFGGGTDITPTIKDTKSIKIFHNSLKNTCNNYRKNSYLTLLSIERIQLQHNNF